MPVQSVGRRSEPEDFSKEKTPEDNEICRQILESDTSIRVAAFIEETEVTGFAESARTKNILSQNNDLRKKIGFWVRFVTELARESDKLFGSTESICVTHMGLKMVTVPLSPSRSLGLSVDRSADTDYLILKIMTKFDLTGQSR